MRMYEIIDITKGMKKDEKLEVPATKIAKTSTHNHKTHGISFEKNFITEEDLQSLSLLKEILSKSGATLDVTHNIQRDGTEYNSIYIYMNEDKVAVKTTRNAGRKQQLFKNGKYKECTVSELKMKLESGMKKTEIINELGCPKATFYRILKNLGEDIEHEDVQMHSIWIYTT